MRDLFAVARVLAGRNKKQVRGGSSMALILNRRNRYGSNRSNG